MNQELEQILDEAILALKQGQSIESLINRYPEFKTELLEFFPIVSSLQTIQKEQVPTPIKKYKYLEAGWSWIKTLEFISIYKFSLAPAVFIFVLLGTTSFLYAASQNSLPGERLYPIRTAGEQTRLTLTFDQQKIATLHVELAQKRLEDVKRAIETKDPEQELAAITELTKQTEKTLTAVSQIAADPTTSEQKQDLLENLVAINKEQKTLIAAATDSPETKEQATIALTESKETDINLAKLIATVNEQTLIDLPNKISITGIMTNLLENQITVEKNVFTIDTETVIVSSTGEITTDYKTIQGKVTVIGTRDNNVLLAKKIVVIDSTATVEPTPIYTPAVKGIVTPPTPVVPTTTTPETTNTDTDTTTQKPDEAFGGFIAEPVDSKYSQ